MVSLIFNPLVLYCFSISSIMEPIEGKVSVVGEFAKLLAL